MWSGVSQISRVLWLTWFYWMSTHNEFWVISMKAIFFTHQNQSKAGTYISFTKLSGFNFEIYRSRMVTQISIRAHFDAPFSSCWMYHELTSYFMRLFIFGISTIIRHMSGHELITPTTLQYMMNPKLSKQRFWHCHENVLIKTIQTIPRNL